MALGPRVKGKTAVRRVPLNLKVPPELRATMEKAADRSGRSLGAEVEFRVHEYQRMSDVMEAITKDRALIPAIIAISNMKRSAAENAKRNLRKGATDDEVASPASYAFAWAMLALFTLIEQTQSKHLQEFAENRDDVSTDLARDAAEHLAKKAAQEYGLDLWRACFPPGVHPGETLISAGINPPFKPPTDFVPPPSAEIQGMRAAILKPGKTKPVATIHGGKDEKTSQT